VVTLDDATSAIYSAFLVATAGTLSSFRGIAEVIAQHGLFCELYTDRGSYYFDTPNADEAVSKTVRTQVAGPWPSSASATLPRARPKPAAVPSAFRTLQDRLPKELVLAGIVTIEAANRWQKRFRRASCASRKSAGSATTTPSNGVCCLCKSVEPIASPFRARDGARTRVSRRAAGDLPWSTPLGRIRTRWITA